KITAASLPLVRNHPTGGRRRRAGNQQHLPRRLARLQRAVRRGGLRERGLPVERELQAAGPDPSGDLAGAGEELLPRGRVVAERGPGQIERAALGEDLRIQGRDRTARLAEERQEPARRQAPEALLERRLPDRVVDDRNAPAFGQPPD